MLSPIAISSNFVNIATKCGQRSCEATIWATCNPHENKTYVKKGPSSSEKVFSNLAQVWEGFPCVKKSYMPPFQPNFYCPLSYSAQLLFPSGEIKLTLLFSCMHWHALDKSLEACIITYCLMTISFIFHFPEGPHAFVRKYIMYLRTTYGRLTKN